MNKITIELLDKLEAWKQAGDRSVEISNKHNNEEWSVWIYDYSVMAGAFLEDENVDKDWDALILTQKRQRLAEELALVDNKLGGVA